MTKEELIKQNMKLAYMLANRYYKVCHTKVEFEEIRSASFLGLVKAANSFDEDKGLAFSTFAFTCIKNEILIYLKSVRKHQTTSIFSQFGEDMILLDTIANIDIAEDTIFNKLEVELLYKYINELPDLEKKVLLYHLQGKTIKQIGDILHYSPSQISNLYRKSINKLRDKFMK